MVLIDPKVVLLLLLFFALLVVLKESRIGWDKGPTEFRNAGSKGRILKRFLHFQPSEVWLFDVLSCLCSWCVQVWFRVMFLICLLIFLFYMAWCVWTCSVAVR